MFVVVSNTGNWDHDMWGVVGVIKNINALPSFIKQDIPETDMAEVDYVKGENECYESFEENEVNFLCSGTPISYAMYEPVGCFPSIYYVVEFG